jgi:hypothetical protein
MSTHPSTKPDPQSAPRANPIGESRLSLEVSIDVGGRSRLLSFGPGSSLQFSSSARSARSRALQFSGEQCGNEGESNRVNWSRRRPNW